MLKKYTKKKKFFCLFLDLEEIGKNELQVVGLAVEMDTKPDSLETGRGRCKRCHRDNDMLS